MSAALLPLRVLQNRIGVVPRPSYCTYLVCNRCNARCSMCDSWKVPRGYEMTPREVGIVFGKVGALDVVRLTGGEPFLRKDLVKIAAHILEASNPSVLHLTTNGSFPDRAEAFCRQLDTPQRLWVMVSVDGLAREHDHNRGRSATLAKAYDTVRRLAALGRDRVRVSVNHTIISNQSLADHDELCQMFAPLGVDVQWVLAYESSAMYGLARRGTRADDLVRRHGYPLCLGIDRELALEFMQRDSLRAHPLRDPMVQVGKRYYLSGLFPRLARSEHPRPQPKCVALRSHLRLLPDGGVPVCQFNTELVGNLVTDSFEQVWNGAAACNQRAWVDACSGCWAECEVMPNAVYSGDVWRGLFPARRRH